MWIKVEGRSDRQLNRVDSVLTTRCYGGVRVEGEQGGVALSEEGVNLSFTVAGEGAIDLNFKVTPSSLL